MFIGDIWIAVIFGVGGYVTSIHTWPWLRTKLMGVKAEIDRLDARIKALVEESAKPK